MSSQFDDCLYSAIKHIGIATYSSGKIFVYLVNKGFSEAICREVIDELITRGYIDDFKAARKVLISRSGKKQESKYYMEQRLLEAGICEKITSQIVSELDDDFTTCLELFKSYESEGDIEALLKLAKRRGYDLSTAQKALKILNIS